LLAAVGTESLALTAAHLSRAGVPVLLGVALACWALGLAAYAVIAVPVVRRITAARGSPEVLGPDVWVLMGALAIATLSGSSVVTASGASGALPWVPGVLAPALVGLWALATAWVPVLVAGEVRRARRVPPRYERVRWATVFPVGMYSAACSGLAVVLAGHAAGGSSRPVAVGLPPVLRDVGDVAFWVALLVWGVVSVGLVQWCWRRMRRP
jgi:tellurite resistance protein TehA-like permease